MEENHGKLSVPTTGNQHRISIPSFSGVWRWNQATVF